ncbi:MAG: hypothetical protein ILO10_02060, partial [Kiritimatiellae bacterium]|nr:hypothetical protein [Kiritimatiellia bacterium]
TTFSIVQTHYGINLKYDEFFIADVYYFCSFPRQIIIAGTGSLLLANSFLYQWFQPPPLRLFPSPNYRDFM